MVLSNSFKPDLRVYKEAKSLTRKGYKIIIVSWDRECKYDSVEYVNGITIKRIKIPAPYGTGIFKLNRTLLFYVNAIRVIKQQKFSAIHCHDLDTLVIGVIFKVLCRRTLIYDSHENYSKMIRMSSPYVISFLVERAEKLLLNFVDSIIVASSTYGSELEAKTEKPVNIIGNWQDLTRLEKNSIVAIKDRFKGSHRLLVTYIGGLDKSRSVIPMIEAVKSLPEVRFIICGDGVQKRRIEEVSAGIKNVTYIGAIPQHMVPYYTAASDVVYYVMSSSSPIANYNAPNSLGFALVTGKAIIASDGGDLGNVVKKQNCGIVVKDNLSTTLRSAIQVLLDKHTLMQFQKNALNAGKKHYNWQKMEEKLFGVYEEIMQ